MHPRRSTQFAARLSFGFMHANTRNDFDIDSQCLLLDYGQVKLFNSRISGKFAGWGLRAAVRVRVRKLWLMN